MQIRIVRAGGLAVLGALLTLSAGRVCGAQGREELPEDRMFGLRLLKSGYKDVLQKFGQPQEIQVGGPYLPTTGAPSGGSGGNQGGGLPGFGGLSGPSLAGGPGAGGGAGGGGKRPTSKNGFPGGGGSRPSTPGLGGGPGGAGGYPGGYPGSYPGITGPGGKGGLPGFAGGSGGPGGYPGGYPGSYPGVGGPGGEEGGALPGGGAAGGDNPDTQEKPETEATWWYHDPVSGLHKSFLFNKDGVLIQIQEYGSDIKKRGDRTRRGVGLGSGLGLVLNKYGWSSDGAHEGTNMIMRYGSGEYKVAFQLVKNPAGQNAVIGITIGVVK